MSYKIEYSPDAEEHLRMLIAEEILAQFRTLMQPRPPHERLINISKAVQSNSTNGEQTPNTECLLGEVHILGIEMPSCDVVYLKKSAKLDVPRNDGTFKIDTGEKIIGRFFHDKEYELLLYVVEVQRQNIVVQPLEIIPSEWGRNQSIVLYDISKELSYQPNFEIKHRSSVSTYPSAPWELRIDDFHIFYDVEESPKQTVYIRAIGVTEGDHVSIGGEKVGLVGSDDANMKAISQYGSPLFISLIQRSRTRQLTEGGITSQEIERHLRGI